jgi:glycosyltransferase involved in cell wall biosynthesis
VHRLRPLVQVGNAPVLPQLLRVLGGFDVIHLHYPFYGGEFTALAAKLYRTPLVVTYHQDVFLSGLMGVLEKLLRHSMGRFTLRTADRLLFTSRDYGQASYVSPMLRGREQAIGELPNGVDSRKFTPVHPLSLAAAPKMLLRERYRLADGDKVALLVAGLDRAHYFKGVNIFLQALGELPPTVKGVIVGDGELRQEYEATAKRLGMAERLFFAGRVTDEALPHYYRFADVTVLPSVTMGEAFGLVLLESLASGTPVIASNLPGVRTVVAAGQDGFLVQPGNVADLASKLTTLLALPAHERAERGLMGRRKVKKRYSWQRIGRQLEAIYEELGEKS